ncbi:MAG: hypothetical protein CSA81_02055 [Acidobacteria bacterium]|nr:MAG: hypothetical protein CSA81_02055 [Acidobacteriota bacterium]
MRLDFFLATIKSGHGDFCYPFQYTPVGLRPDQREKTRVKDAVLIAETWTMQKTDKISYPENHAIHPFP